MICYFEWCAIKVYKMCNSIGTFQQLIPQTTKPILSVTGAPLPLSLSLSLSNPSNVFAQQNIGSKEVKKELKVFAYENLSNSFLVS